MSANAAARVAPRGLIRPRAGYYTRRVTNTVMLTLTGLATLLAVVPLVWIIVHVAVTGGQYVSLNLFTKMPAALNQSGGGVLHAIEGTLITTLLATLFSVPVAVLAAFYAAFRPN